MKKIKKLSETSRGGRRQMLVKNKAIRNVIEGVNRQTGVPLQFVFDEFLDMVEEGHLFGIETHSVLFARALERARK